MFGNIESQRKAIETTYTDTCNVYNFEKVLNGSITSNQKVIKYKNLKCALSQKSLATTEQTQSQNKVLYDAKLFLSPDVEIETGSYIEIKRYGKVLEFEQIGEPFIYSTHQEMLLKRKTRA